MIFNNTVSFFVPVMLLSLYFVSPSAAAPLAVVTGDPSVKPILEEVKENLSEAAAVKDADLTEEERNRKEAEFKKKALLGIVNLSVLEISDLLGKLDVLKGLGEEDGRRDDFRKELGSFSAYYEEFKGKLAGDLTLEEVKGLAVDFRKWREEFYGPVVSAITDFIFIYSEKPILAAAGERLKRITVDVGRIKARGLAVAGELESPLSRATALIDEARDLNAAAEDLFRLAASTTAAAPVVTSTVVSVAASTSTSATSTSTAAVSASFPPSPKATVKNLIRESLNKIKGAYRIFINMSELVKKELGR